MDITWVSPPFGLQCSHTALHRVRRRGVCRVSLHLGTLLRMSLRVGGFFMLYLRFSEFPFLTAACLHELRPQALPDGVRVRFFLNLEFMKAPGPSQVRGEMAMAGLRLLLLLHGVLYVRCCPFSFVYSDSQLPDTANCCRVSFKSRWGSLLRSVLRRGGQSPRYRRRKCRSAKPSRPAKASGVGVRPPKGTRPNHGSA